MNKYTVSLVMGVGEIFSEDIIATEEEAREIDRYLEYKCNDGSGRIIGSSVQIYCDSEATPAHMLLARLKKQYGG